MNFDDTPAQNVHRPVGVKQRYCMYNAKQYVKISSGYKQKQQYKEPGRKEFNVLVNDALNTFY